MNNSIQYNKDALNMHLHHVTDTILRLFKLRKYLSALLRMFAHYTNKPSPLRCLKIIVCIKQKKNQHDNCSDVYMIHTHAISFDNMLK